MQPQADLPEGLPHIRPFKHDSRQALSSQAGCSDGMVCALGDFEQICPIPRKNYSPPDEISYLGNPSPRCQSLGSLYSEPVFGRLKPPIFLSHSSTDQHDKLDSQSLYSDSDHHSPGVAQPALVLGPERPVPDTIVSNQLAQLVVSAL